MNVLLIDVDRPRGDHLAEFLRGRGHRVDTASGVDAALQRLRERDFDAVVTAWRLGSDDATSVAASAHGPCIVIAATRAEVVDHPAIAAVLTEPVAGPQLAAALADVAGRDGADHLASPGQGCVAALPVDTRDRVLAVLAILDDPSTARVDDDGRWVTIEGHLAEPERWIGLLDGIGGDLRVLAEPGGDDELTPLRLLLRLDRRGLPAGVEVAIGPEDPWPDDEHFAIDFHGAEVSPHRLLALCDRIRRAGRSGREVALVNVPSHLRLCLEAVGRADDLPIRKASGPRLPEALGEIWR